MCSEFSPERLPSRHQMIWKLLPNPDRSSAGGHDVAEVTARAITVPMVTVSYSARITSSTFPNKSFLGSIALHRDVLGWLHQGLGSVAQLDDIMLNGVK